MLLNLIGTLAPTTEADSLSYHFALPKQFIREHGIIYIPDWYANTPLTQHMLYTLGMGLRQDTLPALINYLEGLALVVSVLLFCRKYLSLQIGLLAALLLYTMPQLTYMTGSGIVESGLTLFTFLAFWAFYEWLRNREIRWLVIIGMFVGFAIGTKYYGLISFVAFGSVLGLHLILSHGIAIRELVKTLVIFCAISAIIGSPWYIRNAVNTGNPVYPALYGVFGGRDWSPELDEALNFNITEDKRQGGNDLPSFLLSPWNMTVKGDLFGEARTGFGPVFLAFIPVLLWLLYRRDPSNRILLGYILIFSLIFFTIWFWMGFHRHRHLLPIMPGISIATSMAIFYLTARAPPMKWIAASAVGIALLFNLGGNLVFNAQFVPVVFGAESKEAFLKSKVAGYEDVLWINEHLGGSAKILHWSRTSNYYLDVDYQVGWIIGQGRLDWSRIRSVEGLTRSLEAEGITYLWVDEKRLGQAAENSPDPSDPIASMDHRSAKLVLQVVSNSAEEVYRSDRTVSQFRTFNRGKHEVSSRIYRLDYTGLVTFDSDST